MAIRVVLADDHGLVRACVRALLDAGANGTAIEVVDEAEDGRALLRAVRRHRPDVAVVDVSMPLLDGIEATRRIRRLAPDTRVVILTMHDDAAIAARARSAGATGYVVKDAPPEQLAQVIARAAAGEQCIAEKATGPIDEPLTPREREVLQLIAEGKRNREIAEVMNRSIHTVRAHRARLMRKLGARSGTELLQLAEERGLLAWPL
jgi:DNA-binding NarL/FixJ family response regulator